MMQPVQMVYRGVAPLPLLEADARRWHARLERCGARPLWCRVTVEAATSRQRPTRYEVRIEVGTPGPDVVISAHHRGAEPRLVARRAFMALQRELRERVARWREVPATARADVSGNRV